jgi:hypothetical protein
LKIPWGLLTQAVLCSLAKLMSRKKVAIAHLAIKERQIAITYIAIK